ncbi:MAG: 50S ribosomal protein L14 [Candidatus Aenigmarchaeota archaeon]|nr:50S ribosomal protein L14 [Candidatus Aenigmarchaeota archaeon]
MKPIKARITRGIPVGAFVECADNTGAKLLRVISVFGYKGRRRRKPSAGIADLVNCTVKEGTVKWRKQIVRAVIVRQKKEFRRPDGLRVEFEDNAAVLVNEKDEPIGSQIKGPIAKEVVERFSRIGKIASIVV